MDLGDVGIGIGVEIPDIEEDIEAFEAEEGAMEEEKEELREKIMKEKQAEASKPVITYVSRQDWGRRMLKEESHDNLVKELHELEEKYGWEVSQNVYSKSSN